MPRLPLFLRLLRHKRAAWISFVSIYALGLSVFLVVNGLARNFQEEIRSKSKELLEADLRVHARRPFTAAEESALARIVPKNAERAEVWGFLSMLRAGPARPGPAHPSAVGSAPVTEGNVQGTPGTGASRLVQVKAVSRGYPLVGSFAFAGAARGEWSGDMKDFRSGDMLVPKELLAQLKVR